MYILDIFQLDSDEQDSDYEFNDVYKCKHASCGHDALLHLLYKMKTNLCPTKVTQKIATSKGGPTCTNILNNVEDEEGKFLKIIYKEENIEKGSQKKVLQEAEGKFIESKQKAGILSYRTESYNHCVNIHISKQGKMKIYDANYRRNNIHDLEKVRYLEVLIFDCDETDGTPYIVKRWSSCHFRHCMKERKQLTKPREDKSSLSQAALQEGNEEV